MCHRPGRRHFAMQLICDVMRHRGRIGTGKDNNRSRGHFDVAHGTSQVVGRFRTRCGLRIGGTVRSLSYDWQGNVVGGSRSFPQIDQVFDRSRGGTDMEAQMKINGEAVRALREQKSWSQEHLASASGLSARTVQRVELESVASAETRLALAAALGVPVADLIPASPSTDETVVRRPAGAPLMHKTLLGLGIGIAGLALAFLLVAFASVLQSFFP